jgi:hypothetical protein
MPLPVMPHWDDDGFQQINCPAFEVNGFAGRQVEGFLDVAHFAWIHTDTFADPDNQVVPTITRRRRRLVLSPITGVRSAIIPPAPISRAGGLPVAAPFRDASAVYRHPDDPFSRRGPAGDHERRLAGFLADNPDVRAHRA